MESIERADIIAALTQHRALLRRTVRDLNDEQASLRTTVSALCLGGIIKHVAAVEEQWQRFILEGPTAFQFNPEQMAAYQEGFRMQPGETLQSVLERYDSVAARTEELVRTVDSLDDDHPLPAMPWFEPGARWSARRVLLHILAETSQHAGHADIIRESLDGARTMG